MNTNVDFEEHTVDKEKRQKKIESKKRENFETVINDQYDTSYFNKIVNKYFY